MSELANIANDIEPPQDLESCQALIRAQGATITTQHKQIEELQLEQEKLRKLLDQLIHGHRSEKRILSPANQSWLPFEDNAEFQAARAEAEAQAQAIVETYTIQRKTQPKKPRSESLPSHLRREEQIMEADDALKNCPEHGERQLIG